MALKKELDFIYQFYSKRLEKKTMMFPIHVAKTSEFIFNRFQHVKMVTKISKRIADVLISNGISIDKNIVESIAKLHDVGHTPFG
ncbi:MAG: HD domain-containing protein, partial [Bacilli bacterium]